MPTVTIDIQTYNDLLMAHAKLEMLLDSLFDCAELTWQSQKIQIYADNFSCILKTIDPFAYDKTFNALKERSNESDKT